MVVTVLLSKRKIGDQQGFNAPATKRGKQNNSLQKPFTYSTAVVFAKMKFWRGAGKGYAFFIGQLGREYCMRSLSLVYQQLHIRTYVGNCTYILFVKATY